MDRQNLTLLTDFYELTMGNGYLEHGMQDRITYFDVFFRSVPDDGGYAIAAGLEQIIDYIENGNIINSVNLPAVSLPRTAGAQRICVIHKNDEELSKAILGKAGSVAAMVTKARGGYAYTIIDANGADVDGVKALDGVVRVRSL